MEKYIQCNAIVNPKKVIETLVGEYKCECNEIKDANGAVILHIHRMSLSAIIYLQQNLISSQYSAHVTISNGLSVLFGRPLFTDYLEQTYKVTIVYNVKDSPCEIALKGDEKKVRELEENIIYLNNALHDAKEVDYDIKTVVTELHRLVDNLRFPFPILRDICDFCAPNILYVLWRWFLKLEKIRVNSGEVSRNSPPLKVELQAQTRALVPVLSNGHQSARELNGQAIKTNSAFRPMSPDCDRISPPQTKMTSSTTKVAQVNLSSSSGQWFADDSPSTSPPKKSKPLMETPKVTPSKQHNVVVPRPLVSRLRPVIIDGQNVAYQYKANTLTVEAITYAVKYFQDRGHDHITVIVPVRFAKSKDIQELFNQNLLRYVPSRMVNNVREESHDDLCIIETAMQVDGVIVSNDQYRKETERRPDVEKFVKERLLMFYFSGKHFIIPEQVHGPNRPKLQEILTIVEAPGDCREQ